MKFMYILALIGLAVLPCGAEELQDTLEMKEITITSSPKESSPFKQQALSSTTLSLQQLQQHQVTSLKGLSYLVPNFHMPDYGSRMSGTIYIRGIGSRINTPAVGLYVDDVPVVDKSSFDFNLADIEHINVLRGPQSTLYGRNTMGGLVQVYTRNPMHYEGTDLHMGYATGDQHRTISLTHYHHSGDKVWFSAGGYYDGAEGFFRNDLTGKKVDGMESGGGRLRAIWAPTGRLTFDAQANYDYTSQGAYPYYYQGAVNGTTEEYVAQIGTISNNEEGTYRRHLLNAGVKTKYKANTFEMNNVLGYQHENDHMFMDQDFLPSSIYTLTQTQRQHTLSDEFTMKSQTDSPWEWVTGVSALYQWLHTTGPVTFEQDGVNWLGETINGYLPDLSTSGMGPMNITLRDSAITMGGAFDTPLLNLALFHQSTYHLSDRFSVVGGLRLDYEHQQLEYDASGTMKYDFLMTSPRMPIQLNGLTAAPAFLGSLDNDYLQLLPRLSLKYDLTTASNLYATVSRGTRSGGYNVQMFSDLLQEQMRGDMMNGVKDGSKEYLQSLVQRGMPAAMVDRVSNIIDSNMPVVEAPDVKQTAVYRPEYSWNYEIGTHLSTNDHRWMADASIFFIDTRDQQIARFSQNGYGRMMVNAGHSQSCGTEVSLQGRPNRHLAFIANYGYTHSVFRDYDGGNNMDFSGNYVPFVPQHTGSLDGSYTFFFLHPWLRTISLGATYSGAGRIYWTENNSASQDFYSLLSARAVMQTKWVQVELWGHNLTNTHYNTFYFESMNRGFCQHGKPLQIGIDLRFHF